MPNAPATASGVSDETSPRYAGWRVVVACFAMAVFCWGFGFYGQGIYLAALGRQHHWSESLVSGATTAYYLFSAVLVIFVGDAITRFGPRVVVLAGIVCLGASTALVGQVATPWQLYADYALMSFGWATMSVAAITTIAGVWFDERRGLAISLALTGASVGGFIVTPVLVALIGWIGFASALLYAVAAMLIVLVPMTLAWVRRPPNANRLAGNAASPARAAGSAWTRRRALRDLGFWTVSASFALVLFVQVGFLMHQIAFLELRIGRIEAGLAVAATALLSIIGRVGLGFVIDRLKPRLVSAISFLSQAAALVSMIWATDVTTLLIACAVYGFSVGNVVTFPSLIIHREFETAAFPMLIAFSTAITQFAYAFGPGALGLLRSATGSYVAPLILCAGLETVAAIIVLIWGGRNCSSLQTRRPLATPH